MRVAALYDIHGNLPALEVVLDQVKRAAVDRVVVGGDVVPGPMVRETLDRLLSLHVPVDYIKGNCEVALLAEMTGRDPGVPAAVRPTFRWAAQQFGPEQEEFFGAWPLTTQLDIPPIGRVLFCHGTPRHENEIFTRLTSEEKLRPIFDPLNVALIVCGHTHMQFDRMVGKTRVVNAGSVGMPFGRTGADWLLLGPDVELRHETYDLAKAAERIERTDYPDAKNFANQYVLNPWSEEQVLGMWAAASL